MKPSSLRRLSLVFGVVGIAALVYAALGFVATIEFVSRMAGHVSVAVGALSLIASAVGFAMEGRSRASRRKMVVAKGRQSVAAGGDVVGNALGRSAIVSSYGAKLKRVSACDQDRSQRSDLDVVASGERSIAAGDDAARNAIGDESQA